MGTSEFIQYPIISALRFVLVKAALMGRWFVYCAFWINRAIMAATCALGVGFRANAPVSVAVEDAVLHCP